MCLCRQRPCICRSSRRQGGSGFARRPQFRPVRPGSVRGTSRIAPMSSDASSRIWPARNSASRPTRAASPPPLASPADLAAPAEAVDSRGGEEGATAPVGLSLVRECETLKAENDLRDAPDRTRTCDLRFRSANVVGAEPHCHGAFRRASRPSDPARTLRDPHQLRTRSREARRWAAPAARPRRCGLDDPAERVSGETPSSPGELGHRARSVDRPERTASARTPQP